MCYVQSTDRDNPRIQLSCTNLRFELFSLASCRQLAPEILRFDESFFRVVSILWNGTPYCILPLNPKNLDFLIPNPTYKFLRKEPENNGALHSVSGFSNLLSFTHFQMSHDVLFYVFPVHT